MGTKYSAMAGKLNWPMLYIYIYFAEASTHFEGNKRKRERWGVEERGRGKK